MTILPQFLLEGVAAAGFHVLIFMRSDFGLYSATVKVLQHTDLGGKIHIASSNAWNFQIKKINDPPLKRN